VVVDFGGVGGVEGVPERFVFLLWFRLHHEEGDGILSALRCIRRYLFGGGLHDCDSNLKEARLPDADDI